MPLMHKLLNATEHRPYPPPTHGWAMEQVWYDLLFMHWPIKAELLAELIPSELSIDEFDGTAWIGVVPFAMENVHFRHLPPFPTMHRFPELNVRTYVRFKDKRAVYFFSLDAGNPVAVDVARTWFRLPYYVADMSKTEQDGTIIYQSKRIDNRGRAAELDIDYAPTGEPFSSKSNTLENFLTERYCFFTERNRNEIVIGEVHHKPWPLQSAFADIRKNTMITALGLPQPEGAPLLHFSRRLETIEWAISTAL